MGHTCERQRLRRLAATWKLHLWGERGGGTARLHVNQALYKFSLCLKVLWLPTRAPGKKRKTSSAPATWRDLRCFKLVGFVLGVGFKACVDLKWTAFCFLPNRHSRGRLSFSRLREEEDKPTGRQECSHNDASYLGFLARWPHLGKAG